MLLSEHSCRDVLVPRNIWKIKLHFSKYLQEWILHPWKSTAGKVATGYVWILGSHPQKKIMVSKVAACDLQHSIYDMLLYMIWYWRYKYNILYYMWYLCDDILTIINECNDVRQYIIVHDTWYLILGTIWYEYHTPYDRMWYIFQRIWYKMYNVWYRFQNR